MTASERAMQAAREIVAAASTIGPLGLIDERKITKNIATALDQFQGEWQKIETAPKDGTYVLVYPALSGVPLVASWQNVGEHQRGWFGFFRMPMTTKHTPYQPTHWRPLPPAPKPEERVG